MQKSMCSGLWRPSVEGQGGITVSVPRPGVLSDSDKPPFRAKVAQHRSMIDRGARPPHCRPSPRRPTVASPPNPTETFHEQTPGARAQRPAPVEEGRRQRLDRLGARVLRLLHLRHRGVADLSADLLSHRAIPRSPSSRRSRPTASATSRGRSAPSSSATGATRTAARQVLILCMFLMGFSTMAVGLLPTYDQVGLLAPALLVILRLIQGFAVAGEISGASSMILEHAPFGRRGFFASFTLQGVQAGQILAAAVFLPLAHYMPDEAFNSLGLAHSLPAQLRRHRRGLHHPPRGRRDARLRRGRRARRSARRRRSSRPSRTAGATCCASSAWR